MKLKQILLEKILLYYFIGTNIYSVSAVTFLEYWKRKSASLAHHWDCMGFQDEEERPRWGKNILFTLKIFVCTLYPLTVCGSPVMYGDSVGDI